ncbi:MAG TPA: tripartite tricarboxylate transporter substrate binding protein [Bacillota bacterium]
MSRLVSSLARRRTQLALVALLMVLIMAVTLTAGCANKKTAKFPSKAITIIVPMNPGGGADTMVRGITPYLQKALGQPILVENVPGPGSVAAIARVTKDPADGYTLLTVTTPIVVSLHLYEKELAMKQPFLDSWKSLGAFLTGDGNGIVVRKGTYKTIDDLVAASKTKTINVAGATGIGSSDHTTMLQVAEAYGAKFTYIPNKGGGEAMAALLGGHVEAAMVSLSGDAVDLTRVDMLGISLDSRYEGYPNIPTFKEMGHPELTLNWAVGLFAPAGTPDDVVKALDNAVSTAFKNPDFQNWAKTAKKPIGSGWNGQQYLDFLKGYEAQALKVLPKLQEELARVQSGK